MLGAIVGDIAGSRFEWHNIKTKEFELLTPLHGCRPTDDTMMSLAVAKALLDCNDTKDLEQVTIASMQSLGRQYPNAGYGSGFSRWLSSSVPEPYHSFGNGAAMRVSACGYVAESEADAKTLANIVTKVTHNHPEGLKAAEAVAVAIYMARSGKSILDLRDYITQNYYDIAFTLDEIRDTYTFDVTC